MKICIVDHRGRVQLKKLVFNLPTHYKFEENVKGQIVLTPLRGTDTPKEIERNNEINHS